MANGPTYPMWRCGAARAVRFAACALVAPELLSAADMDALLGPWRAIIGEPGPIDP